VKNKNGQTIFAVYNEGVRIYVDDGIAAKKAKGGFAIGGFDAIKAEGQNYFFIDPDSIRMYIDDNPLKKSKGGFAIGGFDQLKSGNKNFLNVATDASGIINPSQNRVMWYPIKNAFLAGRVRIGTPDSVGENSFATGYESKSRGMYSQAMGFKAIANGDYSTAIGKNAVANSINAFAFGDGANTANQDSYAFGALAQAQGKGSYAIGSTGRDTLGNLTGSMTIASGDYSFAIGQGSTASNILSFAIGSNITSSGKSSLAMGYNTIASASYSTAIGYNTTASGVSSTALGSYNVSSGSGSTAMGLFTKASGMYSTAMGSYFTEATGNYSTAIGRWVLARSMGMVAVGLYNEYYNGSPDTWVATDPVFVVGNGSQNDNTSPPTVIRSNALTVLKNGYVGIGISSPSLLLHLKGNTASPNPSILFDPYEWNSTGDYGEIRFKNTGHYIRGEYGNGMTFYDSDKFYFGGGNVGIGTPTPAYKLDVAGDITSRSMNAFRLRGTSYSQILRNDGSDFYFLYTNSGDPDGLWNGFRPFRMNLATGNLYFHNNVFTVMSGGNVGIGTNAPDQKFVVYNGTTTGRYTTSGWTHISDIRLKENITSVSDVLSDVLKLQGVRFNFSSDNSKTQQIGFIAQDVEKIFPEFVVSDSDGYKSIAYGQINAVLVEAIKEQQKQIDSQQKEISELKDLVKNLLDNKYMQGNK
jgi:hypothetical protein